MSDEQLTTTSCIVLALLSSRNWSAYELAEQAGRGARYMLGHFAHTASWAEWALAESGSWERTDDPRSHHGRSAEILEGSAARSADSL